MAQRIASPSDALNRCQIAMLETSSKFHLAPGGTPRFHPGVGERVHPVILIADAPSHARRCRSCEAAESFREITIHANPETIIPARAALPARAEKPDSLF